MAPKKYVNKNDQQSEERYWSEVSSLDIIKKELEDLKKDFEKAKNIGVGWGILRNTTHQGCMGYYSMMAAETNMAGIAVVCSPPNMAPHGAKAAGTHNAPISIAVPGEKYPSLVNISGGYEIAEA